MVPDTAPSLIAFLIATGANPLASIAMAYMLFDVLVHCQTGLYCDWLDARYQAGIGNIMNFSVRRMVVWMAYRDWSITGRPRFSVANAPQWWTLSTSARSGHAMRRKVRDRLHQKMVEI